MQQARHRPPPPIVSDNRQYKSSGSSILIYAKFGAGAYFTAEKETNVSFTLLNRPVTYKVKAAALGIMTVPGISLFYGYRYPKGHGIEAGLEYEFDYSSLVPDSAQRQMLHFFTPALYYSYRGSKYYTRVGLGYDVGIPYRVTNDLITTTSFFHGIAILFSEDRILTKRNSLGFFAKLTFRYLSESGTFALFHVSKNQYDHFAAILGLNYRFKAF
ncbi:hypothetical protein [Helicobacter sp. MIT 14-3879]|uniref:hypothetical protein n=1 Tax=Helicobacter sp. MIT 14-3879 TaxID=2040649 RepID=UPI0011C07059|nr:hypothetical protein [Helicobacter sp. MIT 14-3879]